MVGRSPTGRPTPRPAIPSFRGHDELRASLRRALERHLLPTTVLIHGIPGCGKQSLALWLARTRLCTEPAKPCDHCKSCRMALRLEHPDIHWYFPLPRPKGGATSPKKLAEALEDARCQKLAEFREHPLRTEADTEVKGIYLAAVLALRRRAHQRPAMGEEQLFVIGDAEYLVPQEASPEAANALLKLLEEPPNGCLFFLTSGRPGRLLDTIRSRALPVHLPPLPISDVSAFLEQECRVTPSAAKRAAVLSQGSIGRALGFLDAEGIHSEHRKRSLELLRAAVTGRRAASYAMALTFGPGGARGLLGLLGALQLWIRDLTAVGLGCEDKVINTGELAFLRETARRFPITPSHGTQAVDRVEDVRALALGNVNPQLLISTLLVELEKTLTRTARS